ncbi:MAG: hypothetical protein LBV43_00730 [Prevotella sp.]|nr:hypothetical protein [Prevotella sp.]
MNKMNKMNKMNNKFIICFISLFITVAVQAQVTIGSGNPPVKGAVLDIKENESATGGKTSTKGVVFPRVSLDSLSSLTPLLSAADASDATQKTTHKGTIVYNVNVLPAKNLVEGFYYWDATKWIKMLGSVNDAWLTQGNVGTDTTKNFVGTADNQPLVFKVNKTRAGYISNIDGFTNYTAFGYKALSAGNTGEANVAFGYQALLNNTSGAGNTAIGMNALAANKGGGDNTAVGNRALANSTGIGNTAVGSASMMANGMTGSGNVGVGQNALQFVTGGGDNTATGTNALQNTTTGVANAAFGNNALVNNVSGSTNTAVGTGSLILYGKNSAPAGQNNTAVGKGAGSRQTAGSNNIFLGVETQLPDTIGSNQMNIGNTIFGTGMNGTLAAPAGRIGIRTNNPTQPFHVNSLVGGVKNPIRFEGLPDVPANTATNPLNIDANGNVYQSKTSSAGEIFRNIISEGTTYDNTEKPLRLDASAASTAPNGAKNNINTIAGGGNIVTSNTTVPAGNGSPARTTDRILLPPGVYQVTVRLIGKFNAVANDNAVFIKAIVNNNEYSLANQVTSSADPVSFYYADFINIEGTASQYLDFTAQTVQGRTNTFTIQSSVAPAGGGASVRSMVLIQRLR